MYGLVNRAIEDLVRQRYGNDRWEAIRSRAGVDAAPFVSMQAYPDAVTYRLVAAASEELGVSADTLLEAFGQHWTLYTGRQGYGETLALGGRSFVEFLQNLDALHANVALSMPQLRPPSFWCTNVTDRSLRLHYRSEREGLAPMVIGLIKGLGEMFRTDVTVRHARPRGGSSDHDEFEIEFAARP